MIGSKEDLIEKVVLGYIRSVQIKMVEIINSESDYFTALEKVTGVFPEFMNSLYTDSMQEIFAEYPRVERSVRNHRDDMTRSIVLFIKSGADSGVLRKDINPEFVFEIFQAIVIHYVKSGHKGQDMSQRISEAFRCMIYGIKGSK
jgi:hypothetical protein